MNSSTQFDWDEIKRAWDNCYGENLETFYYGFYLELEKIAILQAHYDNAIANELGIEIKKPEPNSSTTGADTDKK